MQGNSGGASGISYGNATVLVENSSVGDIYGAYLYNGEAYKQGASVSAAGNSIKISVTGSSTGSIYSQAALRRTSAISRDSLFWLTLRL